MKVLRYLVPMGIFLGVLGFLFVGLGLNPREVPSPLVGKPAPAFQLPRLDDPAQTVGRNDLLGKVWMLNVWASWCAPCREEHPLLVEAAKQRLVPIVGLNYKDDPRNGDEWLRKLGDPYQHVAVDRDGRVAIDYGVYGVPETFVIDRDGIVRLKHIGPLTPEVWAKDVLPLISKLKS
jgi:cytochrome c biogenesis protein CcmG/thiol:disulfide interchange protein DsbE